MQQRGLQLPGYEGDKPFVYACFAYADRRRVIPYLQQLQDRRFRLSYYDDGRPDGLRSRRMAARITDAQLVLLFYSERANSVPLWRYQVNFATDAKKRIYCVRLDDSEPSHGMALQFAGLGSYRAYKEKSTDDFFPAFSKAAGVTQALIGDNVEGYPKGAAKEGVLRRVWFYAACATAVAAAVLAFILPPRIRAMREAQRAAGPAIEYLAVINFSEPLIQEAVVQALGKGSADTLFEDDLQAVETLRICGGACLREDDIVRYGVAADKQRAYINGYETGNGNIQDIRELAMLKHLTQLTVSGQQITDASPLESLQGLTALDISGNPITDISPLSELTKLTRLDISCLQAEDFSVLRTLTGLRALYIRNTPQALDDVAKLPLTELCVSYASIDGAMEIIAGMTTLETLDLSDTDVTSIAALSALPNLRELYIRNCGAITDMEALLLLPSLTRVYLSGADVLALPDETFRALLDRGVEIVL